MTGMGSVSEFPLLARNPLELPVSSQIGASAPLMTGVGWKIDMPPSAKSMRVS